MRKSEVVTAVLLKKNKACNDAVSWFGKYFPEGLPITKAGLRRLAKVIEEYGDYLGKVDKENSLEYLFGCTLNDYFEYGIRDNEKTNLHCDICTWSETSIEDQINYFLEIARGK